jgi:predicted restriction endonuclease
LQSLDISNVNFEQQYQLWASGFGNKPRTIQSYVGALKNTIPNWLTQAGFKTSSLLNTANTVEFEKLALQAAQLPEFQLRDKKGKRMYSAALKSYQKFLEDFCHTTISEDIAVLIKDKHLNETEKSTLIKARLGQGQFRSDLIQLWQGCALTHYKQLQFLVASHIKPWRMSDHQERLNPFNGLLLLANLDKAFDLGYITFKDKGQIVISHALDDYKLLGIRPEMYVKLTPQHQDFVAYHREHVFIN